MLKNQNRFAVCIDNREYPVSLELHKIYQIFPDDSAEMDGDFRVVDESGEDYLYRRKCFILMDVPSAVENSILHACQTR